MNLLNLQAKIYFMIVTFLGTGAFMLTNSLEQFSLNDWNIIFILVASILLLNHNIIELPPNGNRLSMDSSIFLASLFLFGMEITLTTLLIYSGIFMFTQRKTSWWKHVFNFGIYSLMIIFTYFIFHLSGGEVGHHNFKNLLPYITALTSYFAINVLFISVYFLLAGSENMFKVLRGMIKGTIATYVSTLMLSLVLMILIDGQKTFGLVLFIGITLALSVAFKQHIELYKEVSDKANKDFLTGLNNHGYFKELLDKELAMARDTGKPLSVAILDIDDFKKYNDLYGHIQGDQLLKGFGALLQSETEAMNYIVARYGGEEFSIIMPNTLKNDALAFINLLRKKTNDTPFEGVAILPYGCLSFSAGIAESEIETYSTSELLNKADLALYSVKDEGKNMVQIYNEHSDYSAHRTLNVDKELAEAEQQLRIFLSKDIYTYRHSKRVYKYAVDFSKKLNLSDNERKTLIIGALIHDIGKLEIPRDIINKKGKLEPHEWAMIKKHVTWGKEIISTNKKLDDLIPIVELHHERFDGKGYPFGLEGNNIPKLARILCVIDSFDAMTTERPYQKTKSCEEAFIELRACAGKQFDPEFVEPFIEMIEVNYGLKGSNLFLNHEIG